MSRDQKRSAYFAELLITKVLEEIESVMDAKKVEMTVLCESFNDHAGNRRKLVGCQRMLSSGKMSLRNLGIVLFLLEKYALITITPISPEQLKKADVWASR